MDVAAMSTIMSQSAVQQQASIAVLKIAMQSGESRMGGIVDMVQQQTQSMSQVSGPQNLGHFIDIKI
jgi:hypothetical protein